MIAMNLKPLFERSRAASLRLNMLGEERVNEVLLHVAAQTEARTERILAANAEDLARMERSNPMYDRLMLTPGRIAAIAADMRNVATLPSPLGHVLDRTVRPNGMRITRVSVPFGVIGVIYEARPNVGFDVFSLCFKSGNACLLKGGSDARCSNAAIVGVIREALEQCGENPDAVIQLPPDREATAGLLAAAGDVDLIIPRGSKGLIEYVRDHARVPVIETGVGIRHTYFDAAGDVAKGAAIINNAKTRRVSVCNALDTLVIHSGRLSDLPSLCAPLAASRVLIYADARAFAALDGHYPAELLAPASDGSFGTEFLDYKMSVRTVDSIGEAMEHVARYSSKHSEAIVTEDPEAANLYMKNVDAACVYVNVSTAFTDGAQFGFGAEIGISTQKLHARGPMALRELTTYKYLIEGDGQTRP